MIAVPPRVYINGRFLAQPVTGVQRYAREVVKALDELLCERVIDPQATTMTVVAPRETPPLVLERIRFRRAGRLDGHAWEQLELPALSRDGVLLNLCNTAPLAGGAQVVTFHDAAVFRMPQSYTLAFRAWYRSLWAALARLAPAICTVSEFSRRELAACLGIAPSRIQVVGESGEHVLATAPDAGILERHRLRERPYVFAVSTANPSKNFAAVVRAIQLIGATGFDFVLAGGVDPHIFARDASPLPDTVKHVGYVSDGELRALYEHAACFVHPSLYEGFGLPALEAMHCGCPVLASTAASIPEVCGEAALYCDARSPVDIAAKLHALMHDPGLRQALARRGRAHAGRFSWRTAADRNWDAVLLAGASRAVAAAAGGG